MKSKHEHFKTNDEIELMAAQAKAKNGKGNYKGQEIDVPQEQQKSTSDFQKACRTLEDFTKTRKFLFGSMWHSGQSLDNENNYDIRSASVMTSST